MCGHAFYFVHAAQQGAKPMRASGSFKVVGTQEPTPGFG